MNPATEPLEHEITPESNPATTDELPADFISYLNSIAPDSISEMLAARVIPSMLLSLRRHGLSSFSGHSLRLWSVDMLISGLKGSTVKRYVGAIRTLYKEWLAASGSKEDETVFSLSLAEFVDDASVSRLKEVERNLEATERFARMSLKQDSSAFVYNKAFQYLLFDPFATLKDIVNLK
ncbi:MAG: hypothetical protein K2L00_05600, partial [Muribaculaceae bacterium]|nr:hypothetical protein [Muribaculaceae bacterium]